MPSNFQLLRIVKVYSLDDLRSISAKAAPSLEAILFPSKRRYLFNPASRADDDGDKVIAPVSQVTECCQDQGRWEVEAFSSPSSGTAKILEAQDTAGNSGAGGAYITDATISFTLTDEKDVDVIASGTANIDFALRTSAALGIEIDGVQFPGTTASSSTLGSGMITPTVAQKFVHLGIGPHTIKLFGGGSVGLISDASRPTRLRVILL